MAGRPPFLCLVEPQRAVAHGLAVEGADGVPGGGGVVDGDERKSPRPARVAVGDDAYRVDGGVGGEVVTDVVFGGAVGQVADVDVQGELRCVDLRRAG